MQKSYSSFKYHLVGFGPSFQLEIILNYDSVIFAANLVRTYGIFVNLR